MKTVILAAGQGARLLPLTEDIPKCLVELCGKPLLDWQCASLRKAGIEDIIVVAGHCSDKIDYPDIRKRLNPNYATTNMLESLMSVEDELEGDVLVAYGDIVYSEEVVKALLKSQEPISVVVDLDWKSLWEMRMDDPLDDAETLKLGSAGEILELGRPAKSLADIEAQYIGMILFRESSWPEVKRLYRELDRNATYDGKDFSNMYMTSFLTELIKDGQTLSAVRINGGWCEVDNLSDLIVYEAANFEFLDGD